VDAVDAAVLRLHEVLARRVAGTEAELAAIVASAYAAIRHLPPEQVAQAMRLASQRFVEELTASAREGLRTAARLGAQASRDGLRVLLGSDTPPAVGWERAARFVEARGPDGLSLSARIHQQTTLYRHELDQVLARSLREGQGAEEMARRLVGRDIVGETAATPKAIRELEAEVRRMGVGGGDGAWAAASDAAVKVRQHIERLVSLPTARHGMAPATEHMVDAVTEAVWKGRQAVAEKALDWWARDKVAYQEKVVARTEMQRAYARAFEEHAREVPAVEGLIWNATIDGRTCEICLELNGQTFAFDDHPEMPAHPQCRCRWLHLINTALLSQTIVDRALAA